MGKVEVDVKDLMKHIDEALQIDVKEVPEQVKSPIVLDINIDSKGEGNASFEANGFLEYMIISENVISTYNILCANSSQPQDIVCNIKETKGGLYSIRRLTHNQEGKIAESDYTKIYMNGNYNIRVTGGTPETILSLIMVVS